MTDQPQTLRESILKETFRHIDQSAAVVLVGILFDYRVVLSKTVSNMVQQTRPFHLDPLEPQSAADLVGSLYGFDPDSLFLAFEKEWARTKTSTSVKRFLDDIQSHKYVDRLEPWEHFLDNE